MESTNFLHNNRSIKKLSVIAYTLLAVSLAATSYAGGGSFWVQLSPQPAKDMGGVERTVEGFTDQFREQTMVCIEQSQYYIVHEKKSASLKDAEKVRKLIQVSTPIVQIPDKQCFALKNFMKPKVAMNQKAITKPQAVKNPAFPRPVKRQASATDPNSATRMMPLYANSDRAQATVAHAPKVLDNTKAKVLPEVTTQINLSSRDVNRITCSGNRPVKDIVFSSEKGMSPKISGNNVFIKFLVEQDTATGEIQLSTTPTEMHVVCGAEGTIYSLIAVPRNIPAQTVELTTSVDKVAKNLSLFKGLSFEKKVLTIVKQAYKADYPESYTIKHPDMQIDALANVGLETRLAEQVDIEGEGLRIKEYHLNLAPNFEAEEIKVLEKYFLLPALTENPVAIAMDTQFIRKDGHTRLIIIEQPEKAEM